jgi:N-acetylglucosaminyldiphosphoundecaprenol N-acetyl-beta-D-mannosaminyltransferase
VEGIHPQDVGLCRNRASSYKEAALGLPSFNSDVLAKKTVWLTRKGEKARWRGRYSLVSITRKIQQEADFEREHITRQRDDYRESNPFERISFDEAWARKIETIRSFLGPNDGAKVLDIGCNTGGEAIYLASKGYEVVAGDPNDVALELARERCSQFHWRTPEFVCFDAHRLPFADESFDFVVCWEVLHHLADLPAALQEIQRVLRPGGRGLAYEPYAFNPYRRFSELQHWYSTRGKGIERSFSRSQLKRNLEQAGLQALDLTHVSMGLSSWKARRYSAAKRLLAGFYQNELMQRLPRLLAPMLVVFEKPTGNGYHDVGSMVVRNPKTHQPNTNRPYEVTSSEHRYVLGTRVDSTSYVETSQHVVQWAREERSAYVCVANVHTVMEAYDSEAFRQVVNRADLVTPDGRPLVWALKGLGMRGASQVRGADLTMRVVERAARENVPIGLYGGTSDLLESFVQVLETRYPKLRVACCIAPPFRPLTPEEDEALTREIAASGARILFVGIGCPKQEKWMAAHKGRVPAVMLGVGAAFDFHTGRVRQAPRWMQVVGLEWMFRLMMDPRRLWKRYAKHNPRFVTLFVSQLLGLDRFEKKAGADG